MNHSHAERTARPINYLALTEVLLLGGTGTLLLMKWLHGTLSFYIHPRYTILVVISGVLLLLMAGVRLRGVLNEPRSGGFTWLYALLAMPLLLGTLVPAQPLGADTLAGRGLDLTNTPTLANQQSLQPENAANWNLLEWVTAASMFGGELDGRPVNVEGFVFIDEQLGSDGFFVARYVVTCCAADAAAAALPVSWEGGSALPADSWVRVQGTVQMSDDPGSLPVVQATQVEPIDQPDAPYLFP
jgi:uncharacterized repeat protein (TIGR03943 family)